MGYMNEFPHSTMFDSDLRQILEMYVSVKNLPAEWAEFKKETIARIDEEVQKYLDINLEALLDEFVYDVSYNAETETIYYIRRKENKQNG